MTEKKKLEQVDPRVEQMPFVDYFSSASTISTSRHLLNGPAFPAFVCFVVVAAPSVALACGNCTRGIAWLAFPPLITLANIGPIWLLVLGLIAAIFKEKIPVVGSFWKLALFIALGVIFDLAMTGIALTITMLVCASIWSLKLFTAKMPFSSKAFSLLVKIAGSAALLCAIVFGSKAMMVERSASEAVLRYGTPAPFFNVYSAEEKRKEARKLIEKATAHHHVEVAAHVLSKIAEPVVDVPLLISAMARFGEQLEISHDMTTISGLDLPRGTSPDVWLKEWEKKNTGAPK